VKGIATAAEKVNSTLTALSLSQSQQEVLSAAIARLEGSFGPDEKKKLLKYNCLPETVSDYIKYDLDSHSTFSSQCRTLIIGYYILIRGKLFPLLFALKDAVVEWMKAHHASDDSQQPLVSKSVVGVSLRFLKEFVKENNISNETLTATVVRNVIVPKTASQRETYVNSHLLARPDCVSDLRKTYRKNKALLISLGNGMISSLDGFFCFLSHAWSMPFVELVKIAERSATLSFKAKSDLLTRLHNDDDILDNSFFWIDVFCKNQHIPAPAMEEFHMVTIAFTFPNII
jgi:hypothetical protein